MPVHQDPVPNVVEIHAKKDGHNCPACGHHVHLQSEWDVGAGDDSGIYVCPSCDELQTTTVLSDFVVETPDSLVISIPKTFLRDLDVRFDPSSDLDFAVLLRNAVRPFVVDLFAGEPTCLYRE